MVLTDEMNMFAPQSIQTQTELRIIADVTKHIISPKDSKPVIKPVQDSVLGSYKITSENTKIEWRDMMNLLSYVRDIDLDKIIIDKTKTYTGKELFSNIIPQVLITFLYSIHSYVIHFFIRCLGQH